MNFVKLVFIFALVLEAGTATGGTGRREPDPEVMNETPVYTETDRIIKTEADGQFTIALDSNPTTGYSWDFAGRFDEGVIALVDSRFQPPATRLKGAGGTQFWTFRALKEGKTEISLKYFRSWEKGIPPVRKAVFSITVGEPVFGDR